MQTPYNYEPTQEEVYEQRFRKSYRKAKHLFERVEMFKKDIEKSSLKSRDKKILLDLIKGKQDTPEGDHKPDARCLCKKCNNP